MSHFDHLDLDGHLLQLLLAVLEEGSITRAAQRLGELAPEKRTP